MTTATGDLHADTAPGIDSAKHVVAILSQASESELSAIWAEWADKPTYTLARGPETGLVMIRGRTGGGGAPFNLGEATVTRASVRLSSGEFGHSYALGRGSGKAVHAALFHALWQRADCRERVEIAVLEPLRVARAGADALRQRETAATKVDFFTMVRGDD